MLQAVEKLLLAEGTKIAMTKMQSAYDQGVYGLVVNLGSIAARLLFQPFEEAAFMSFSLPVPEEGKARQQLKKLKPLVRVALLFGAFFLLSLLRMQSCACRVSECTFPLALHQHDSTSKMQAVESVFSASSICKYVLLQEKINDIMRP